MHPRFRLMGDWPCGQHLIPADTEIEVTEQGTFVVPKPTDAWSAPSPFLGMAFPAIPPINAMALNQEGWDLLMRHHGGEAHRLRRGF